MVNLWLVNLVGVKPLTISTERQPAPWESLPEILERVFFFLRSLENPVGARHGLFAVVRPHTVLLGREQAD